MTAQVSPSSELDIHFDPRSAGAALESVKRPGGREPTKSGIDPLDGNFCQDLISTPPRPIGLGHQIVHPNLRRRDLEIMHNFFTATVLTLAPKDPLQRHLLKLIPLSAQSNDYVLYALLGVSALHLASLHPESDRNRYHSSAIEYLCKGVSGFRAAVDRLHPENINAVFTFSGLTILCELALMHPAYEIYHREQHQVDRFIQVYTLIRDVMALWLSFPRSFHQNVPLKPRFQYDGNKKAKEAKKKTKNTDDKVLRIRNSGLIPEISSIIQRLHELNHATTTDLVERQIYSKTIDHLYITFYKVAIHPEDWTLALRWVNVSLEYTQLLQARRPLALVVLGHYCGLLHHGPGKWWMRDWGRCVFNSVFQLLDDSWIAHLSWAMEAVQPGCPSPLFVTNRQLRDIARIMDK